MSDFLTRFCCSSAPTQFNSLSLYSGSEGATPVSVFVLQLPSADSHASFNRDIKILQALAFPGLIALDEDSAQGYIVERTSGIDLRSYLQTEKRFDEREAYHCMIQLLKAATVMWSNGLNLENVNPSNIIVDTSDGLTVTMSIFAVCQSIFSVCPSMCCLEGKPEQEYTAIRGKYNRKTDAWLLGILFGEMLVGLHDRDLISQLDTHIIKQQKFDSSTEGIITRMLDNRTQKDTIIREMEKAQAAISTKICGKVFPRDCCTSSKVVKVKWRTIDGAAILMAVKKVALSDELSKTHFEREGANLKRVESPFIVDYVGHEIKEGYGYIVTKYVSDYSLRTYLNRERVQVRTAFRWLRQITKGLEALWEQHIVYRNLSSEHVLLTKNDQSADVKLCGFSLSKNIESEPARTRLAADVYSPPEVQLGEYTKKSDVWCLGVLLYEMIVGAVPGHGDSQLLLASAKEKQYMASFERMLEPDPDHRMDYTELIALLADRFKQIKEIGSGGYGKVYSCLDSFTEKVVAKKVIEKKKKKKKKN